MMNVRIIVNRTNLMCLNRVEFDSWRHIIHYSPYSIFCLTNMFFIIFILFFSKYFPGNSLRCMTASGGFLLSSKCTFELNINDPIPDDTKLTTTASKCEIKQADSILPISISDSSCYSEVSIDYNTKKMIVTLTHVTGLHSFQSPYDDMFGFLNGIQSVVQYKINGHLEKEKVQMITRIQCKTYDNCALDKLRKLLPNLTISDTRWNIFKELRTFLNTPESTQGSPLTCVDNNNADVQCLDDDNRCRFEHSKDLSTEKGCTTEDSSEDYDLEYRFNVIQEIVDNGIDNSAKALKCFYLCNTDHCNSEENFLKVDNLLNAFAIASSSSAAATDGNTNNQKPAAQSVSNNVKSDVRSFFVSFYYRSIVVISLLIQILSN